MLTRKCSQIISELLGTGDFNVRLTVVKKFETRFVQKSAVDGAWKETFRDSIGGGIIHDSKTTYKVSCRTENNMVDFAVTGDKVINECWKYLANVDVARIDLTKFPTENNKTHSWIVARD